MEFYSLFTAKIFGHLGPINYAAILSFTSMINTVHTNRALAYQSDEPEEGEDIDLRLHILGTMHQQVAKATKDPGLHIQSEKEVNVHAGGAPVNRLADKKGDFSKIIRAIADKVDNGKCTARVIQFMLAGNLETVLSLHTIYCFSLILALKESTAALRKSPPSNQMEEDQNDELPNNPTFLGQAGNYNFKIGKRKFPNMPTVNNDDSSDGEGWIYDENVEVPPVIKKRKKGGGKRVSSTLEN